MNLILKKQKKKQYESSSFDVDEKNLKNTDE